MMTTIEVENAMLAARARNKDRDRISEATYRDDVSEIQSQCPHEHTRLVMFEDRDYIIGKPRRCIACRKEFSI